MIDGRMMRRSYRSDTADGGRKNGGRGRAEEKGSIELLGWRFI